MGQQMRTRERGSGTGLGRRMLAAVVGWWHRLRGAERGSLPPLTPAEPTVQSPTALVSAADRRKTEPRRRVKKAGRRPPSGPGLTLEQVSRFLEDDGFRHHLRPDHSAVETGFRAQTGAFQTVIFVRQEPALIGILVRLSDVVPESKRPAMAEAIARANYGLSLGCFELDMSDGEMDFRVGMPTGDAAVSRDQFRSLMGSAMWTVNRYHRAFSRLLYGDDLSPAEVIAEVEMADGDEGGGIEPGHDLES